MNSAGRNRVRRLFVRATLVALALALAAALWFLPRAGRFLVVEDPLQQSDAIVVLAGSRAERWLEAVELYRAGWAPRVVLSPGSLEEAEIRVREMGVRLPTEAELAREAMIQMQIPASAIIIIPGMVDNTAQEAEAVRVLCGQFGWRRIIVVSSKYHTRRVAFAFARELHAHGVQAIVRGTRYDIANPDRWWRSRTDFRFVTSELQKLVAYRLGLGGKRRF